jgi:flagellar motor protein MotB
MPTRDMMMAFFLLMWLINVTSPEQKTASLNTSI